MRTSSGVGLCTLPPRVDVCGDLCEGDVIPLCVDLDGTLLKTDLLWEGVLALLRHRPLQLFSLMAALVHGRAAIKTWLAEHAAIDATTVPFRTELVVWLKQRCNAGQPIVLATASPAQYAEAIAKELGFVSRIFATSAQINLKGSTKARALEEAFGAGCFDYVGDSGADLAVWKRARIAFVVGDRGHLCRRVQSEFDGGNLQLRDGAEERSGGSARVVQIANEQTMFSRWSAWRRAIRVHQWLKNALLCVPALAAHTLTDISTLVSIIAGLACFSVVASSAYLMNDLLDLEADRQHPTKRSRPFAAGQLPLLHGIAAGLLLLLAGFALAAFLLPSPFLIVLGIYYGGTCTYSLLVKRWAIVDVVVLGSLYVLRIIAGGVAAAVPVSFWLLAFSLFLFFSLALGKRYTELLDTTNLSLIKLPRRGYRPTDLPLLLTLGIASGFISVLVMALYINSGDSQMLYHHPQALWFLIPVLLLWVSRLWLHAHRAELHEDPVVYALTDRGSLSLGVASIAALLWAVY